MRDLSLTSFSISKTVLKSSIIMALAPGYNLSISRFHFSTKCPGAITIVLELLSALLRKTEPIASEVLPLPISPTIMALFVQLRLLETAEIVYF